MKRKIYLITLLLICFVPSLSFSQSLGLTINPTSIVFPDADPDTTPSISAPSVVIVSVSVSGIPANQTWRLIHRSNGNLQSGTQTIAITNVTWTATPQPPFRNGTMRTTNQTAGSGTGNISVNGNFQYFLRNQWTYRPGNYTASTTFTLSSP